MKKMVFLVLVGLIFNGLVARGDDSSYRYDNSAFKSISDISGLNIAVPTIIDSLITLDTNSNREVVVVEKPGGKVVPSLLLSSQREIKIFTSDSFGNENANYLTDGRKDNYVEYPILENGLAEEVEIHFDFGGPISLSALSFQLDSHVALPTAIEVTVGSEDNRKIVLARKNIGSHTIFFPETIGSEFFVRLNYVQPLRIREIEFGFNERDFKSIDHLRFLAQPGKDYVVHYNADRYVDVDPGEYPDLTGDDGVRFLPELNPVLNSAFVKADVDGDGIVDQEDNCVSVKNIKQEDVDQNGRGDACDDFDRDGIINSIDNCVNDPNKSQKDTDLDGRGDVCDEEESRLLQNQAWLPTVAIIVVLVVIGGLIVVTIRRK